jgi:hypothetical protein
MARLIPNENTWVGFTPTVASATLVPTTAEITGAVVLTGYLISINASTQGNVVPTPTLDTLFETSISGTVQATFTADFYRDDQTGVSGDLAWTTLPRKTNGFFIISRFGGKGTKGAPIAADKVEVWPIRVVSRTMANMSNNTVMTFTLTASVPVEPNEAAVIGP